MANKPARTHVTLDHEKLRLFLASNCKSQSWLADKLDCCPRMVTYMLTGVAPRGELMDRLSALLETPINKLVKVKRLHGR